MLQTNGDSLIFLHWLTVYVFYRRDFFRVWQIALSTSRRYIFVFKNHPVKFKRRFYLVNKEVINYFAFWLLLKNIGFTWLYEGRRNVGYLSFFFWKDDVIIFKIRKGKTSKMFPYSQWRNIFLLNKYWDFYYIYLPFSLENKYINKIYLFSNIN